MIEINIDNSQKSEQNHDNDDIIKLYHEILEAGLPEQLSPIYDPERIEYIYWENEEGELVCEERKPEKPRRLIGNPMSIYSYYE